MLGSEASENAIQAELDELRLMHAGRPYHNWQHIQQVIDVAGRLSNAVGEMDRSLVFLALAYHDCVYALGPQEGALSNEARSAQHASERLSAMGLSTDVVAEISRLILLTEGHQVGTADALGQVVVDADLSILSADSKQYESYAKGIAEEYAWAAERYRDGRAKFLNEMIARAKSGRLFFSDSLDNEAAVRNMADELRALS